MPFHISMAALGFTNITSEATTVMVESDKAEYAICTLQAGKIPQQALDLNFTEGEEVKFFLEGDGGDVHLTGINCFMESLDFILESFYSCIRLGFPNTPFFYKSDCS